MPLLQQIQHQASGRLLVARLRRADNFFTRLAGLLGRKPLQPGDGLLITPCQQVHTHFMGYAIDVVFLDASLQVLAIDRAMRPWRISAYVRKAAHVLELPAHAASEVQIGDQLVLAGGKA
ncbi:DUF192 domain-containing protein [Pseudomethylobacillus aquaticus]|uniref:DUF192 domain-containing protein n=1 Tax=Pseudomethylobacillus aquaticus TaxID=2676064 RepID=A0A3N0UXU0_9PROT|nr:DUF192 domain-containing protein [Pseudomethylobacillus aquaticus]ROH85330.1 DUF192 domain-containing protein [Pseudomethylobacillus aquaticus]